jgi:hypothetical protein
MYLLSNSCKVTYDQQASGTAAVDIPTVLGPSNTHSHAITTGKVARSACGVGGHLRLRMNENWRNNADTTDHSTSHSTQTVN